MKTTHEWKRLNNDVNGNPRYAVHFRAMVPDLMAGHWGDHYSLPEMYRIAVKRANKIGGRRYHNKSFGGGIVFQSYSLEETEKAIERLLNSGWDKCMGPLKVAYK